MKRLKFSREYKLEAVKRVRERGVSSAQVTRDLGIGATVVSRWVREASGDIRKAFPGQGQQSADQAEIERLKREIAKRKAEKEAGWPWSDGDARRSPCHRNLACAR